MLALACISGVAATHAAFAGIEDLEVYPWDLDADVRCYEDDALESSRPPTTYGSPAENLAYAARSILTAKDAELAMAQSVLDAAESAARPVYNPSLTYTAPDRIDDYETYLTLLTTNAAIAYAKLKYLEGRLESLDAALAKPNVSFGDLFSSDGDESLALYFNGLGGNPGDTAWGLTDPKAFSVDQLATFLTGDILDAVANDYRPGLVSRIARQQILLDELNAITFKALMDYADLLKGGIALTLFAPPSAEAVIALTAAQEAYDAVLAERNAASTAFNAAFETSINTVVTDPYCDSREFGVAMQQICALPVPVIAPEDEAYVGQSDLQAAVFTDLCGRVDAALPGVEITSDGGGSFAARTVAENRTDITIVKATQNGFSNLPAATLAFAIIGGADQALFEIDPEMGELVFKATHSFETPEDADGNNTYLVNVSVSDEFGSVDTQSLSIALADIQGVADPDDPENILYTQRVIASFLGRRAQQITANDPDLASRLSALGRQAGAGAGTPVSVTGSNAQGFSRLAFSASLTAMAVSGDGAEKSEYEEWRQHQFGANRRPPVSRKMPQMDVWAQGTIAHVDNLTTKSDVSLYYLGADYLVKPNLVVGVLAQADLTDESDTRANTSVEGKGWMAGPYVAGKLRHDLVYDARVAWGKSTNDVNPFGLYTDEFETTRQLVRARLTGNLMAGRWKIAPQVGVIHFAETQKAYTDSLGNTIPEQEVSLGRVSFGPTVSTRVAVSQKVTAEPYAKATGYWDFEQADTVSPTTGVGYSSEKVRARTEAGLALIFAKGWRLSTDVFYDGIGVANYKAYGGGIRVSKSF
ncbi:MAG: outer membrane autotransporter protein [Hyphomonas sp.]|jgi:outer membrane autotransporter protein